MIRTFIVDDHQIFREGLKKVIADTSDIIVVGEAGDGREALSRIPEVDCDVVLLDMALQGIDGINVLQNLRARGVKIPVLILTMYPEDHYGTRAFQAGATGYLTKEGVVSELISAIRKVAKGGCYVSPSLAELIARDLSRKGKNEPHESLSHREYEILLMTAAGKSVKEISQELSLARTTVSSYRTRILEKMKMHNTAELVRYALEHQLVYPSRQPGPGQ
jgi:DNA-binding NarL/FixJ family response regulator